MAASSQLQISVSWCFSPSQVWKHNHDYQCVIDDGFSNLSWAHYFHPKPIRVCSDSTTLFTANFKYFILYPRIKDLSVFVFILVTERHSLSDFMFECTINCGSATGPWLPHSHWMYKWNIFHWCKFVHYAGFLELHSFQLWRILHCVSLPVILMGIGLN